jgi:hypothetical protein
MAFPKIEKPRVSAEYIEVMNDTAQQFFSVKNRMAGSH